MNRKREEERDRNWGGSRQKGREEMEMKKNINDKEIKFKVKSFLFSGLIEFDMMIINTREQWFIECFVFRLGIIDIMSALLQRVWGLWLVQVDLGCDIQVYSSTLRVEVPFTLVIWRRADREQELYKTDILLYVYHHGKCYIGEGLIYFFTDDFTVLLILNW